MRFPLLTLKRELGTRERTAIRTYVRGLLRWNATLDTWPRPAPVPDATPFVALYVGGALRGCYGADEGPPAERLARAFVLAAGDARFGGARREERARTAAQVAYLHGARRVDAARVERELEVGREGIALVDANGRAIVLLPSVARDGRLDVDGFVRTMAEKAKLPRAQWGGAGVFLFRTEEVPVRREGEARGRKGRSERDVLDAAAAHLASLVDARGDVTFAMDPRSGKRTARGEMHHGRVAVAIRALGEHGEHARVTARARARIAADVRRALAGGRVDAWPSRPDVVAGTLALVAMGGVDVRRDLRAWVETHASELAASPWHAAQSVAALGREAPASLWEACARDLSVHPWSPWTAIAARARGDEAVLGRCIPPLVDSIRRDPPHAGGCGVRPVPETALTAVTVEALAPVVAASAAVRRARAFLRAWQVPDDVPAALVHEAAGAFPASPVVESLRVDITAHAMLALRASASARGAVDAK